MTAADVAALVLSILAGLAAVISALTAMIAAIRTGHDVSVLGKALNGRLDMLLTAREARIRAETSAQLERERVQDLASFGAPLRTTPLLKRISPDEDDRGPIPE